ncbi:GCN5-related N-acetyltransferase [Klebsormidium nitens]|uniref:GCN5-related N-acetyltransferase n=1 Tax=Klebsormidium nitens TaxID=105231 RepID=A0A1Y1HLW8_KLENI|nr:GCN5-related N-acetyltransferase [Klebsormidium nitens]|eukprot:GAQ78662.1 GCN5-related N-acetyltransferase [Klebsormidium nitens]
MSAAKQVAVSFDDVREKNLKQLRKLNQVLFPVRYEEKFYTDVLSSGEYTKLAYYSDICVGAIASKLEKRPEGGLRLYIMTLGVLAPYRRLGIASKLLQHCLDLCHGNAEVHEAYLHVQTSRYEAIAFYKKFGFEIVETLENYYKRIDPPHAYVLMKTLQPSAES